jgi:hypothetical protein
VATQAHATFLTREQRTLTTASTTRAAPLHMRLPVADGGLRVFLITNELDREHAAGQRDGFARLEAEGRIEAFAWAAPKIIARAKGEEAALREVLEMIRVSQPNVVIQTSPHGFPFTEEWLQAVLTTDARPLLLAWEGDAFSRWRKPVPRETRAWWSLADAVFTTAFGKHRKLIEHYGARDVRFVPYTYDHIRYAAEEANEPPTRGDYSDVAVIGNCWGNRYFVSRLPGAQQRLSLVHRLQEDTSIPLAVYGVNWTGRGVRGPIHMDEQAAVSRSALITVSWDHFPDYEEFYSDRLTIQLLAGRAHVTGFHPKSEWLPGPEKGLFLEPTVRTVVDRVRELLARPRDDVLDLGLEAHRWVRHRLSDRELARYLLGAIDPGFLRDLPEDPWARLPT